MLVDRRPRGDSRGHPSRGPIQDASTRICLQRDSVQVSVVPLASRFLPPRLQPGRPGGLLALRRLRTRLAGAENRPNRDTHVWEPGVRAVNRFILACISTAFLPGLAEAGQAPLLPAPPAHRAIESPPSSLHRFAVSQPLPPARDRVGCAGGVSCTWTMSVPLAEASALSYWAYFDGSLTPTLLAHTCAGGTPVRCSAPIAMSSGDHTIQMTSARPVTADPGGDDRRLTPATPNLDPDPPPARPPQILLIGGPNTVALVTVRPVVDSEIAIITGTGSVCSDDRRWAGQNVHVRAGESLELRVPVPAFRQGCLVVNGVIEVMKLSTEPVRKGGD